MSRYKSKASKLESMKKMKQAILREGSSVAHHKYYDFENISKTNSDATRDSTCLDTNKEKEVETNDYDDSNMDLSHDVPKGYDDVAGFRVFMYNKSTEPLKSTYLSPTLTNSSLDYIQSLLNETHVYELMDITSHPVHTDANTTSMVNNPEENHETISYKSGASEVSFGTHVDVQATNLVLYDMFLDEAAHHNSIPPANTTSYPTINPQHVSLQAKEKKLMQKAKKNMRKINFKRQ
ncbi:hypothetical protein Tco_0774313 [Tanacetum coccineum]|uniref:Uncharacterized protein n=1 Tax=Tanacetum coccineum TaxID=301880 RepID=A0ABQ4ZRV9_9ASTR